MIKIDLSKQEKQPGQTAAAHTTAGEEKIILATALKKQSMQAVIGDLQPNQVCRYYSRGAWSMHDLLDWLLGKCGQPADITFCTWTISENPARKLLDLKNKGSIKSLRILIDFRIKSRHPKPFQLLQGIADKITLGKCHAKVMVIEAGSQAFTIVTSANMTRNNRLEAGTIFTDQATAIFFKEMLDNEIG